MAPAHTRAVIACCHAEPDAGQRAGSVMDRRRLACLALLFTASFLAALAEAQDPQFGTLTRGCYRLQLGEWSDPFASGMPSLHIPPEIIRFDTTEVTFPRRAPSRRYQLHPNVAAIAASRRPWDPAWTRTAPDSVHLLWTTGFSGVMLDLAVRGDSLFGRATARYDVVGPPVPRAQVIGWRVACPPTLEP